MVITCAGKWVSLRPRREVVRQTLEVRCARKATVRTVSGLTCNTTRVGVSMTYCVLRKLTARARKRNWNDVGIVFTLWQSYRVVAWKKFLYLRYNEDNWRRCTSVHGEILCVQFLDHPVDISPRAVPSLHLIRSLPLLCGTSCESRLYQADLLYNVRTLIVTIME